MRMVELLGLGLGVSLQERVGLGLLWRQLVLLERASRCRGWIHEAHGQRLGVGPATLVNDRASAD